MAQADGSSATIKSSENINFQVAPAAGRRESILVLAMVLGSGLIKSTIPRLRPDRQRPSSFEPACRSALRYA
jgi:hypothetical protein